MSVVATSSAPTSSAYSTQRKVDRCQNGVLWSMWWGGGTELNFAYSTDDGSTWTAASAFTFAAGGSTYIPNGSLFIDLDDYAHVVYKDRDNGHIYYRRGAPNAARTAWTWTAAVTVYAGNHHGYYPDAVVHREGTGWRVHVVYSYDPGSSTTQGVYYKQATVASDGTVTLDSTATSLGTRLSPGYGNYASKWPSIDFNHTGDAKTVAGSAPHLYVAWSAGTTGAGNGVRFKKATYSAGSWTWGTEREIDSTRYVNGEAYWLNCLFDGTRVILPGLLYTGAAADLVMHERDAADTTTTTRTLVASTAGDRQLARGSSTYNGDGDVYLFGLWYVNPDYPAGYAKWVRSTATLEATITVDPATGNQAFPTAKRGYSNGLVEFIYTDGTASPYSVTFASIVLNEPPNAPTLTNPVGGAVIDRTATNRFTWDFNDPNTGDSQSAYRLYYRLVGATTWTVVEAATPNTFHDFAAAHFAAGDYEWQGETADAQGEWGPRSASEFFTAADPPPSPSITDPISGQTIPSENYTAHWSAPSQDGGYEWRRVADNAGSPDTSVVYAGSTSPSTTARSRSISFPVNNRWEHVQWRIKDGGLWSQWASVRVEVSYTPPGIPHVRVTSDVDHLTVRVYNSTAWGYGGSGVAKNSASPPLIDLDALEVGQVLWLPGAAGNYASTPDDASLDITGDIDLRAEVALEDWTSGTLQTLFSRYSSATSGVLSCYIAGDGIVRLYWSPDGGTTTLSAFSSVAVPYGDGAHGWVRVTLNVDNSAANDGTGVWEARFYTSDDGSMWTQLGSTVTGAATTSIAAGTAPLQVGGHASGSANMLKGKALRAQVRNGIDGTLVADFNAADFTAPGTTAVDSTGKTWTINRSGDATAEIVDRNTWAFTGSEYLTLPDRDDLDFGAWQSAHVVVSIRTRATAVGKRPLGKAGVASSGWELESRNTSSRFMLNGNYVNGAALNDGSRKLLEAWRDVDASLVAVSVNGTDATAPVAGSIDASTSYPLTTARSEDRAGPWIGLIHWLALFRRLLTTTERTELSNWDGRVATEPTWLRDEATLYVNADDPVQRTQYTARNLTLNLARTTDEGGVASDLPPVTANRVRRQRLDGTTWVDDPAGYLDLNGSPTIPADSDHPDWAVAHQADYRYEVEAIGDNDTSSRSGWVG